MADEPTSKEGAASQQGTSAPQKEAAAPQPTTKPPEGKIEIGEKFGYPAQLVAYHTLKRLGELIASKLEAVDAAIADMHGSKVLITTDPDHALHALTGAIVGDMLAYQQSQLNAQAEEVRKSIAALGGSAPLPAAPPEGAGEERSLIAAASALGGVAAAVLPLVGSAADLAGYLLRGNYTLRGVDFTLADEALTAMVAGCLIPRHVTPYLPGFVSVSGAPVLGKYKTVCEDRSDLARLTAQLRNLVQSAPTAGGNAPPALAEAKQVIERAQALVEATGKELQTMLTQAEGKSYSPLAAAALQERYDPLGLTHILYLKVLSGGGETLTGQQIFRNARAAYTGGCVVCYVLTDRQGRVAAAETLVDYSYLSRNLEKPDEAQLHEMEFGAASRE